MAGLPLTERVKLRPLIREMGTVDQPFGDLGYTFKNPLPNPYKENPSG